MPAGPDYFAGYWGWLSNWWADGLAGACGLRFVGQDRSPSGYICDPIGAAYARRRAEFAMAAFEHSVFGTDL